MSDSQPPNSGPGPHDGWDLDDLLSGENGAVPEGLRPVARTLDALRVAPVRAELAAEEAARTQFRQAMLAGGKEPGWPAAGTGDARTLPLAQPADGGPRAVPGRHRHRRPVRRRSWQAKALAGAAAAIVVVGAAALMSNLSSSGGHPGQLASSAAAGTPTRSSSPGSPGLDGTAAKEPTAAPTPRPARPSGSGAGTGASPGTLCRQYFAASAHPGQSSQYQRFEQLSTLAGGPANVFGYCMRALDPWAATQQESGSHSGGPGPGFLPSGGSQGSQGVNRPQGPGGNGSAGNGSAGNGPGRNGAGFGKL